MKGTDSCRSCTIGGCPLQIELEPVSHRDLGIINVVVALWIAILNCFTLQQVKRQGDIYETQLSQSAKGFRTDERAWIEIDSITLKDTISIRCGGRDLVSPDGITGGDLLELTLPLSWQKRSG